MNARRAPPPVRLLPWFMLAACGGAIAAPAGNFSYHAQPRDTLIGIGRRLLLEPKRWRDVQALNHIADPRRIPPGAVLLIPYDWLRLDLETATVVAVAGSVRSDAKPLVIGDVLPQGAVIETGPDGSATLDLADGSVVTLQKSSVLKLDEMTRVSGVAAADSIRLRLDTGRLETKVKPHRDVGRFEIVTPVAVSAVRGTEFRDSYDAADPHGNTETLEGTVAVGGAASDRAAADAPPVPVGAGFGTRVEKDRAPLPPVRLLPPPSIVEPPAVNSASTLVVHLATVPGARQYRVQLAADASFHALTADGLTADGTLEIPAPADGDYWLRARSIDALGLEGADAVRPVRQHRLPPPPAAAAPAGDSKIAGPSVHFAWAASATASRYSLQVAGESGFAAPVVDRDVEAAAADVEGLGPGRYRWRVAAVNAAGERGAWSEVRAYTLRPAMMAPDAPRLDGRRLLMSWPGQSDGRYHVEVARDPGFLHPVLGASVDAPAWSAPKPFPGTYYVRVQQIDEDGAAGPFSVARRFTVPVPLWFKVVAPLAIGLAVLL